MIGFIGAGHMATALMEGMILGGFPKEELAACDISLARLDVMRAMGVTVFTSARALAEGCAFIVLAIKPKDMEALLTEIRDVARGSILSIVTGWDAKRLAAALPQASGILRAMPNTPAQVGAGVIALAANHTLTPDALQTMQTALGGCGRMVTVPETLFDAITGVSGSGPAYVYVFIEALADAGVRQGLSRDTAYTLAAQTVLGAAKMVLETGNHPAALKDAVASPAGTTIEALYALEKAGFRGAVLDAVDACAKKAAQMGK